MNAAVLEKYGLEMKKMSKPFDADIKGPLESYIYIFRDADNVQEFIDDIDLAINGDFDKIADPDWGASLVPGIESYWYALITPTHFEIRQYPRSYEDRQIIPLEDWKQILLSWKECLVT